MPPKRPSDASSGPSAAKKGKTADAPSTPASAILAAKARLPAKDFWALFSTTVLPQLDAALSPSAAEALCAALAGAVEAAPPKGKAAKVDRLEFKEHEKEFKKGLAELKKAVKQNWKNG